MPEWSGVEGAPVLGVPYEKCSEGQMGRSGGTFAFAAEAIACLQAIQLGLLLRLREVEIEDDSRSVIRNCKMRKKIDQILKFS